MATAKQQLRRHADEKLWRTEELAERWGLSPVTLKAWRSRGQGPRYIKIGRTALYPDHEIALFEANRALHG
jgi:hypothetical protein